MRPFQEVPPAELYGWVKANVARQADGVLIAGNGLRAVGVIQALEAILRRPVLTANQVTFWGALRAAGVTARTGQYGRLFTRAAHLDETFAEAVGAARDNEQSTEGARYEKALTRFSSEQLGVLIGGCVEAVDRPDRSSFEAVLKIAQDGAVMKALVKPETNLGVCFRDKLKHRLLPKPPRAGYWVRFDMRLLE